MHSDIEFVCAGNNGRSPIAEASGKRVALALGLENQVNISSSGAFFNLPSTVGNLSEFLSPYVDRAIQKGVLTQDSADTLCENPELVLQELLSHETRQRTSYLDLNGYSNTTISRQTIPRSSAQLILPVDAESLTKVIKLYDESKFTPRIELLSDFAEISYSLRTDFPNTDREYNELATRVEILARAAVLKALLN